MTRTRPLAPVASAFLASSLALAAPHVALAAPSPAKASASASSSGARKGLAFRGKTPRFRLHMDTDFFGFSNINDEGPGPDGPDVNVVGFGFGRPNMNDSGYCNGGFFGGCLVSVRPVVGLGFGVLFAGGRALVGGRFGFTVDGITVDDDRADSLTLVAGEFVPYFRWIFLPGKRIRPYVEARAGLGGGAAIAKDATADPLDRRTTNLLYATIGAGGGAHFFIVDAFSLDAGINFDFTSLHMKVDNEPDIPGVDEEFDPAANIFSVAIMLGWSVWFGRG